jgi:hypothetical protein
MLFIGIFGPLRDFMLLLHTFLMRDFLVRFYALLQLHSHIMIFHACLVVM